MASLMLQAGQLDADYRRLRCPLPATQGALASNSRSGTGVSVADRRLRAASLHGRHAGAAAAVGATSAPGQQKRGSSPSPLAPCQLVSLSSSVIGTPRAFARRGGSPGTGWSWRRPPASRCTSASPPPLRHGHLRQAAPRPPCLEYLTEPRPCGRHKLIMTTSHIPVKGNLVTRLEGIGSRWASRSRHLVSRRVPPGAVDLERG